MIACNPHELTEALSTYLASNEESERLSKYIVSLEQKRTLAREKRLKASETIVPFLQSLPSGHACQFGDCVIRLDNQGSIAVHKVVVVEQVYPRTVTTIQIKELAS